MVADRNGAGGTMSPPPSPILPAFDKEIRERSDHPHPIHSEDKEAGTTAVCVLTTPRWVICADTGDLRAV